MASDDALMPFSIGPKTIISIVVGALIIGCIAYVWVLIANLRSENATLTANNQQLQANIAVEQSARQAAEKAAQDLQKAKDDADKAVRDADARTAVANAQLEQITEETANAPDSDKVCNAPALWRAVDRLFSASTAEDRGSGGARSEGEGPIHTSDLSGLAGRPTITIHPSH